VARKRQPPSDLKARAGKILRALKKRYPGATTALNWSDPLQLLVATILSAQCTDTRVNEVTGELFKKYRTAKDYAEADQREFEQEIRSTGFFRQKTKSIKAACKTIAEKFHGKVPSTMQELTALPGVARKTANVVLGTALGRNEGIVVDTHVGRVSLRLGLTRSAKDSKDAVKIENDLMEIIPRKDWTFFGHALILHGRETCRARKPKCDECILLKICPTGEKLVARAD